MLDSLLDERGVHWVIFDQQYDRDCNVPCLAVRHRPEFGDHFSTEGIGQRFPVVAGVAAT